MIPKKESLILADKLVIYNNFATINDCQGRLFVELQVYPTPRITWDFEILGTQECQFPRIDVNLEQCFFAGYSLRVENLRITNNFFGTGKKNASGNASRVFWGDLDVPAHTFHFCLTNTKFQQKCLAQYTLQETINERRFTNDEYDNVLCRQRDVGKFIETPLNSIWSVRLEIGEEALQWLNPKQENIGIGIRLTGMGKLFQPQCANFPDSLTSLTITEAQERIGNLCQLLSYANGGFIAPIFIEAERYNPEGQENPIIQTISALTMTDYQVTSLEQLGNSWLMMQSDLRSFVSCYSSFEKMLAKPFWKDTFYFVLVQYFQAIRGGNWELAASATGAALERLSYVILVKDQTDTMTKVNFENLFSSDRKLRDPANQKLGSKTKVTETRLRLLLERIGLPADDTQEVKNFLDVRNDALHPKFSGMSQNQRWQLICRGIQWIDEVLLWRLGYNGKYLDRITFAAMVFPISGSTPITSPSLEIMPRYNLSSRDRNW